MDSPNTATIFPIITFPYIHEFGITAATGTKIASHSTHTPTNTFNQLHTFTKSK